MNKTHKISELINRSPAKVRIKDYSKVNEIFKLYLNGKYDKMSREIYWYKDFDLFRDMCYYLGDMFKNENFRRFFYRDLVELYYERIEEVWQEVRIKREAKKYFKY
jgi:hypothetical protein